MQVVTSLITAAMPAATSAAWPFSLGPNIVHARMSSAGTLTTNETQATAPDSQTKSTDDFLLTVGGSLNLQAATAAAAQCQPGLLHQALAAAQGASWQPADFGVQWHDSPHSAVASTVKQEQGSEAAGLELVLVICLMAAASSWCQRQEEDQGSAAAGLDSTRVSQVALPPSSWACPPAPICVHPFTLQVAITDWATTITLYLTS